jgi:predicted nucleic acid-binding protein
MTEKIFVDSNVLVYCRDSAVARKQVAALNWMRHLWQTQRGRISVQVLNEFYLTVTAKLRPGMTKKEAREEVRDLLSWQPLPVHPAVLVRSWDAQNKYELSFWDSMIVASAELQECKYILSEDFNEGQEFFGAKVVNPFVLTPGDI